MTIQLTQQMLWSQETRWKNEQLTWPSRVLGLQVLNKRWWNDADVKVWATLGDTGEQENEDTQKGRLLKHYATYVSQLQVQDENSIYFPFDRWVGGNNNIIYFHLSLSHCKLFQPLEINKEQKRAIQTDLRTINLQ